MPVAFEVKMMLFLRGGRRVGVEVGVNVGTSVGVLVVVGVKVGVNVGVTGVFVIVGVGEAKNESGLEEHAVENKRDMKIINARRIVKATPPLNNDAREFHVLFLSRTLTACSKSIEQFSPALI